MSRSKSRLTSARRPRADGVAAQLLQILDQSDALESSSDAGPEPVHGTLPFLAHMPKEMARFVLDIAVRLCAALQIVLHVVVEGSASKGFTMSAPERATSFTFLVARVNP